MLSDVCVRLTTRHSDFPSSSFRLSKILKAASYEWRTRSGCTLVPWDRKAFIDRLVKAYAGLWIIGGDSTPRLVLGSVLTLAIYGV